MLKQKLKTKRIILASKSPRRQELLKSLQIPFEIITSSVKEIYPESLKKHEITDYLSKLKAGAFKNKLKNNQKPALEEPVFEENTKVEKDYIFEIEKARYMLNLISNSDFKGRDVQVVYDIALKLQTILQTINN